jgi:hypothetical protein
MAKQVRFLTALFVLMAVQLTAAERANRRLDDIPQPQERRREAPLLFALPALQTNDETLIEIRFIQGNAKLIQETVAILPGTPDPAVIDVLASHSAELKKLREREAKTPGSVQFFVKANGKVIADEPLSAIEARSKTLSLEAATGEIREIRTFAEPKKRIATEGQYYDPDCIYWCDVQFNSCMEWCDPRGSDCNQCYTWYHDCSTQCPILCEEPKNVTYYDSYSQPQSAMWQDTACLSQWHPTTYGQRWNNYYVTYTVYHYERTEHCDGSYTDRFLWSSSTGTSCWQNSYATCYYTDGYPYYWNTCP